MLWSHDSDSVLYTLTFCVHRVIMSVQLTSHPLNYFCMPKKVRIPEMLPINGCEHHNFVFIIITLLQVD